MFTMSHYGHFVHTFSISALTIQPPAFRIGWAMGTPTVRETDPQRAQDNRLGFDWCDVGRWSSLRGQEPPWTWKCDQELSGSTDAIRTVR